MTDLVLSISGNTLTVKVPLKLELRFEERTQTLEGENDSVFSITKSTKV